MSFDPFSAFLKCPKLCDTSQVPEYLPNGRFVCRLCGTEYGLKPGTGVPPRDVPTSPRDPGWRLRSTE